MGKLLKLAYENFPPATICSRSVGEKETMGLTKEDEKELPPSNVENPDPTSSEYLVSPGVNLFHGSKEFVSNVF
jgi:hypothetical protein